MSMVRVTSGDFVFEARFEEEKAPKTCAVFAKLLPYRERIIHVRWSGEGVWIPLADRDFGLGYENHTSYPAPGQFLPLSRRHQRDRDLLAYGGVHFASKRGLGAATIFLPSSRPGALENGKTTLWQAPEVLFEKPETGRGGERPRRLCPLHRVRLSAPAGASAALPLTTRPPRPDLPFPSPACRCVEPSRPFNFKCPPGVTAARLSNSLHPTE